MRKREKDKKIVGEKERKVKRNERRMREAKVR